ncbi:MAG: glycerophosphodiester phosphodiesterase family protein [Parvularculaceae bacterium]|nr:glycerophosphodiester phosphodiesterase family protein [Parvularculaceae bacterium]
MRSSSLLLALFLAACTAGTDARTQYASSSVGWRIAPESDLNSFFECLETEGVALVSAHRGGPAEGLPENAIETFAATLGAAPAIIEFDVATSADGVLFLLHDDDLARTTTGEGLAAETPWSTIEALRLEDSNGRPTDFRPPTFAEAISWSKNRTIAQVDFKRSTRYEDVIAEIVRQEAEDRVILIAYTMAQAERLHRLAPSMMISLSVATQSDLNRAVAAGLPMDRLLGFTGIEEPKPRLFSILNNQDVEVIFGTLGGQDSIDDQIEASGDDAFYAELAGMGADIIATDRPLAAQAALDADGRGATAGICGVERE